MLGNAEIFSTLDMKDFSWLPLWKRDQELRAKIEKHQKEIAKIKKLPFSREEIKQRFEMVRKIFRERRLEIIQIEAQHVQDPQAANEWTYADTPFWKGNAISPQDSAPLTSLMSCFCIFEIPGVWKEIESVIARLPEGASVEQKKKMIEKEEAKIDECEREINEKLSPTERWIHNSKGLPRPYPRGCRWTRYVEILKVILPYLEELADADNKPLSAEAKKHFKDCGFHKLVGTAKIDRLYKLGQYVGINLSNMIND
jgi:hypothetical protein